MTYRTRTLLKAVAGLVTMAGLGAYAFFGIFVDQRDAERDEVLARLALDFHHDQVVRIDYTRLNEKVTIVRAQGQERQLPKWNLSHPVKAPADVVEVNALLGVLERMDAERRLAPEELADLSQYGLDPPRARWLLSLEGDKTIDVRVGKKSSFHNQLYLQDGVSGGVFLAKGHLEDALIKTIIHLRRKQLTSIEPTRVDFLNLETEQLKIHLKRRDGHWFLHSPLEDRADDALVKKMLNVLRNLRAKAYPMVDIPASAYGLDKPKVKLKAGVADDPASQVEIWFGQGTLPSNKLKVYAQAQNPAGPRAEVAEYQMSAFQKKTFQVQARAPLEFERSGVTRIKWAGNGELVVLEKRKKEVPAGAGKPARMVDRWFLVSPVAAPAKAYKVDAMISALANMRASEFGALPKDVDLAQSGLEPALRSVALYDKNGNELGKLKIGKQTPRGTWVLGSARDRLCLVDSGIFSALSARVEDIRDDPSGEGPDGGSGVSQSLKKP